MTTEKQLYTIQEALDNLGLTKKWLIEQSGLNPGTIENNLDMSEKGLKTHVTAAAIIAYTLGLDIDEIVWPRGLTINGRTALSGHPLVKKMVLSYTVTVEWTSPSNLCPKCQLELPLTGECDDCS